MLKKKNIKLANKKNEYTTQEIEILTNKLKTTHKLKIDMEHTLKEYVDTIMAEKKTKRKNIYGVTSDKEDYDTENSSSEEENSLEDIILD